ncbi:hypothetical protein ACFE04_019663 [Oxalis oulophora]
MSAFATGLLHPPIHPVPFLEYIPVEGGDSLTKDVTRYPQMDEIMRIFLRRSPASSGQAAPLSALEARSSTRTVACTLGYSPDSTSSVYAGKRAARVRALSLSVSVLTAFFPDSDMKKPEFHRVHSLPQPFKVHSHHT